VWDSGPIDPHIFYSALCGDEWSASHPGHFTLWERASGVHWIGGSLGPGASMDDMEKSRTLLLQRLQLRHLAIQPIASHYPNSLLVVLRDKISVGAILHILPVKFPTGFSNNILHSPVYFLVQIRPTEFNSKLKILIKEFYFL
jgi:hypothetical protein